MISAHPILYQFVKFCTSRGLAALCCVFQLQYQLELEHYCKLNQLQVLSYLISSQFCKMSSFLNGREAFFKPNCPQPPRINSINTYLVNHGLRLGKIIGEGSYSKVRLCVCTNPNDGTQTNIACKVINKRKASGDFVNKFLPRELQIVARLHNPNIISVFDVVEFDQNVFIFMDYCNKGDLLEFIKRKGYLSERRSQDYFHHILSAVRYLHGLDLAHRDLKCENILLTQNDIVKISDFGFSRYCRDSTTGKRILSNTYCGSAAYAAPEILQGTMYNPKLYDMWSLGCILFIMMTGHMPYDESNVQKMLQNQTERFLTYPHQVEGLISKGAKRLIRHLLEPDVTRRATIEQAVSNPWFLSLKQSLSKQASSDSNNVDGGGGDFSPPDTEIASDETVIGAIFVEKEDEISQDDFGRQPQRPPSTRSSRNISRGNTSRGQLANSQFQYPASNGNRNVFTSDGNRKQSEMLQSQNTEGLVHRSGRNEHFVRCQPDISVNAVATRLQGLNIPRVSANKFLRSQPKLK